MSLMDTLKGALSGPMGAAAAAALPSIIERAYPGGLQGMLNHLSQSGYGEQVNSWLGHGENHPITPGDLGKVLDSQAGLEIANKLGVSNEQIHELLAKFLPQAVDKQSPDGQLQTPKPAPNP